MNRWLGLLAWLPLTAFASTAPSLLPTKVDQVINARVVAGEYPAVVVAVIVDDQSHVYSFGELGNESAPNADTIFQIGSITKTFTAALLADSVNRHDLKLDTAVADLLPGFKIPSRNGKPITLTELATQHSGLPRLPGNLDPAVSIEDPYADYDAGKLKSFLADYALPRNPGSAYEYSNLGFGLLGYALAQHADTSYASLLQTRIFEPLGMSSSNATFVEPLGKRWAQGHDMSGKVVKPWHFDVLAGAGAINSTGADMLRYLRANMEHGVDGLQAAMQLAQKPRRDVSKNERIGLAWMTRNDREADVVWHDGMTGGYASFIGFTADGQRGVVILTNVAKSVADVGFATLLPEMPLATAAKTMAMSPQQLDAYTGEYQLAANFILRVFRENDQLQAQATGQGAFPIFPSATDAFFARVNDIRIDFRRAEDGAVASLELHQNGETILAEKLGNDTHGIEKASAKEPIDLDTATLQQYVGRYQLAPNALFDITLEKSQLMAQLTGQSSIPIYPSARDEFFYTVVDAQISFERDTEGQVKALVLHQNGADQIAERIKP